MTVASISPAAAPEARESGARPRRLALVASKGSLDGAYPPLILATTAASLGWEVGIFFTFYGLDILHKDKHARLKVSALANPAMPVAVPSMIGMLPGMEGMATRMMRKWMDAAGLPDIGTFLDMARESDVKLFACATTMGVMHVAPSDLIDGVDIAGATAFLDFAADADVSMFV